MAARWREIFGKAKVEPKAFTFKSGMTGVELDASMLKYSVVRIDADGNLVPGCVKGTQQALEFVETAASDSAPEEE